MKACDLCSRLKAQPWNVYIFGKYYTMISSTSKILQLGKSVGQGTWVKCHVLGQITWAKQLGKLIHLGKDLLQIQKHAQLGKALGQMSAHGQTMHLRKALGQTMHLGKPCNMIDTSQMLDEMILVANNLNFGWDEMRWVANNLNFAFKVKWLEKNKKSGIKWVT